MINIARGQITISILEKGDTGAAGKDAEFVKLQFSTQEAYVDSNEHLHINISGKIIQVIGNNIKAVTNPTKYTIQGKIKQLDSAINVSINSDGTFSYINNDAPYKGQNNKPLTHIEILFAENGKLIESYSIPIILVSSATFEIKQATDKEVANIKSRVGKIEVSSQNIINSKQFFIYSDNQPHQSREYDAITDTYIFKCTDKNNDIDFASDFIKLDAGQYMLSFTPSFNGNDIRADLLIDLCSKADFNSDKIQHKVIKYSDIPQSRLYTYQFTVTEDKPYLWLYLESEAQPYQVTLPWIIKLHNVRLLKISEAESLIKQQADQITLQVINQVGESLRKVGIDITKNEVNLIANHTNFVDESGKKYIQVSKDEEGVPHFIFNYKDGETPLYDLGYKGLKQLVSMTTAGKFGEAEYFININGMRFEQKDMLNNINYIKSKATLPKYLYSASFIEIKNNKIYGEDEKYNGKYYSDNDSKYTNNISYLQDKSYWVSDGYYFKIAPNRNHIAYNITGNGYTYQDTYTKINIIIYQFKDSQIEKQYSLTLVVKGNAYAPSLLPTTEISYVEINGIQIQMDGKYLYQVMEKINNG